MMPLTCSPVVFLVFCEFVQHWQLYPLITHRFIVASRADPAGITISNLWDTGVNTLTDGQVDKVIEQPEGARPTAVGLEGLGGSRQQLITPSAHARYGCVAVM